MDDITRQINILRNVRPHLKEESAPKQRLVTLIVTLSEIVFGKCFDRLGVAGDERTKSFKILTTLSSAFGDIMSNESESGLSKVGAILLQFTDGFMLIHHTAIRRTHACKCANNTDN